MEYILPPSDVLSRKEKIVGGQGWRSVLGKEFAKKCVWRGEKSFSEWRMQKGCGSENKKMDNCKINVIWSVCETNKKTKWEGEREREKSRAVTAQEQAIGTNSI